MSLLSGGTIAARGALAATSPSAVPPDSSAPQSDSFRRIFAQAGRKQDGDTSQAGVGEQAKPDAKDLDSERFANRKLRHADGVKIPTQDDQQTRQLAALPLDPGASAANPAAAGSSNDASAMVAATLGAIIAAGAGQDFRAGAANTAPAPLAAAPEPEADASGSISPATDRPTTTQPAATLCADAGASPMNSVLAQMRGASTDATDPSLEVLTSAVPARPVFTGAVGLPAADPGVSRLPLIESLLASLPGQRSGVSSKPVPAGTPERSIPAYASGQGLQDDPSAATVRPTLRPGQTASTKTSAADSRASAATAGPGHEAGVGQIRQGEAATSVSSSQMFEPGGKAVGAALSPAQSTAAATTMPAGALASPVPAGAEKAALATQEDPARSPSSAPSVPNSPSSAAPQLAVRVASTTAVPADADAKGDANATDAKLPAKDVADRKDATADDPSTEARPTPGTAAQLAATPGDTAAQANLTSPGIATADPANTVGAALTPAAQMPDAAIKPQTMSLGAAHTAVNAPLAFDREDWMQSIGARVSMMNQHDLTEARIELHPKDMGRIDIHIRMGHNGATDVSFVAPQADVRQALENALPQLRSLLSNDGLALGQTQVDAQARDRSAAQQSQGANKGQSETSIEASQPVAPAARLRRDNSLIDDFA